MVGKYVHCELGSTDYGIAHASIGSLLGKIPTIRSPPNDDTTAQGSVYGDSSIRIKSTVFASRSSPGILYRLRS
ncbi:hypothetical protein ED733_004931 [Metarhizium rileyi]|uniref:Uncharacterized protein n=1 Tax=Metarhizium rileyi (strain RCEF 4871) TaxID=1649241 RepID=A0A5C6GDI9_METRR|nr:hypothetical protein ED733_004931 [Metarhizium rileyi]